MKYISLAAHNNELIVVNDMAEFAAHFCYSKKQRHGSVDIPVPAPENKDDSDVPIALFEIEDVEVQDDDIL
jgi:hypothetical protein